MDELIVKQLRGRKIVDARMRIGTLKAFVSGLTCDEAKALALAGSRQEVEAWAKKAFDLSEVEATRLFEQCADCEELDRNSAFLVAMLGQREQQNRRHPEFEKVRNRAVNLAKFTGSAEPCVTVIQKAAEPAELRLRLSQVYGIPPNDAAYVYGFLSESDDYAAVVKFVDRKIADGSGDAEVDKARLEAAKARLEWLWIFDGGKSRGGELPSRESEPWRVIEWSRGAFGLTLESAERLYDHCAHNGSEADNVEFLRKLRLGELEKLSPDYAAAEKEAKSRCADAISKANANFEDLNSLLADIENRQKGALVRLKARHRDLFEIERWAAGFADRVDLSGTTLAKLSRIVAWCKDGSYAIGGDNYSSLANRSYAMASVCGWALDATSGIQSMEGQLADLAAALRRGIPSAAVVESAAALLVDLMIATQASGVQWRNIEQAAGRQINELRASGGKSRGTNGQ